MERYAPTIKDLAPRDVVVPLRSTRRSRRAGASGRRATTSSSTSRTSTHGSSRRSSRTSRSSRASTSQVEPTTEPVPIQPTAHYAMGGIPTDVHARVVTGPRRPPCAGLVRGRRMRLRLGPRRQPARDELAAGHRRLRPAGRRTTWRGIARDRPPGAAGRGHHARPRPAWTASSRGRRATTSPTSGRSSRTRCSTWRSWSVPRRASPRWPRSSVAPRAVRSGSRSPTREPCTTRYLMEAVEVGSCWTAPRPSSRPRRRATRAAAPTTARITRSRDDANWLKHSLAYRNDDGSIRLDSKPVQMGPYVPMERKY